MTTTSYKESFYDILDETALPSAGALVPLILDLVPARSMVDVGCANGAWLRAFQAAGVEEILGVDGEWVNDAQLKIPTESFLRQPLTDRLSVDRTFDLAMSLEVGEHLPEERARTFVEDLCKLAPVVLFSAAVPGQGGRHHINEQWPDYWADLFSANGYATVDAIRPRVWDVDEIAWWYRQNAILFVGERGFELHPHLVKLARAGGGAVPRLVHPELFLKTLRKTRRVKRWLNRASRAVRSKLGV